MTQTDPLPDDAGLHLLADHLSSALDDGELEPSIVRVGLCADGFDLGLLPLEGQHPETVLLGLDADPDWHAVGVVVTGWAYRMDERGAPDRGRSRVGVVTLVSRSGEIAHHARGLEFPAETGAPSGEQVDLLQRVLGLPTEPPPTPSSVFWAIEWLLALMVGPAVTDENEALARHPAIRLLDGITTDAPDVVETVGAFHRVCTWSRMRHLAAGDRFPGVGLRPEHAEWLDDGAFARRLLSRCPPLEQLRRQARATLPRPVAVSVFAILEELGVPEAGWPDVPSGASCP